MREQPQGSLAPRNNTFDNAVDAGCTIVAAAIIFSPLVIVGTQIVHWLRTARWYPFPLRRLLDWMGVDSPTFSWLGVQVVVDAVLNAPAALVLPVTASLLLWNAYADRR